MRNAVQKLSGTLGGYVARRVEQPRQISSCSSATKNVESNCYFFYKETCKPCLPSVSLADLQGQVLGQAGLEDAAQGVLVQADRLARLDAESITPHMHACYFAQADKSTRAPTYATSE